MKRTYLDVSSVSGSSYRFDSRDYAWSFGDTVLTVYTSDRTTTHFYPFATIVRATVVHK
jgi:hypothetical protein